VGSLPELTIARGLIELWNRHPDRSTRLIGPIAESIAEPIAGWFAGWADGHGAAPVHSTIDRHCRVRSARSGQPGQVSQVRSARSGQPGQVSQIIKTPSQMHAISNAIECN
jgi:hypothetical protein